MRLFMFIGGLVSIGLMEFLEPRAPLREPRRIRWTANLGLALANGIFVRLTIGGLFLTWVAWIASRHYGLMGLAAVPPWWNVLLTILILDFAFYLFHRWLMHAWGLGWRFHLVHHTDLDLDVTSASRFHLGELVISMVYTAVVVALVGPSLTGVVIYEAAKLLAAQFNHSNWRLPRRFEHLLGYLFVTPAIHWVHHSIIPRETNSNYANIFSIWDRLLHTYRGEADAKAITLGLPEYREGKQLQLHDIFILPLRR